MGIFRELLSNAAILVALSAVYELSWLLPVKGDRLKSVISGVLTGALGLILMLNPLTLAPGLIFDTRSILLSVAALFFGPLAGGVAVLMLAVYRLVLAGPGLWMGLATISGSWLIGSLAGRLPCYRDRTPSWWALLELGLVVHLYMLFCTRLLPGELGREALGQVWLPVMTLYPLVTLLLGLLLVRQRARNEGLWRAAEMENRFRGVFFNNHAVMLLVDPETGQIVEANGAAARYYGWSRDQLKSMRIQEINQLPEEEVLRLTRQAREEERVVFHFRHRNARGEIHDVEVFSGPIPVEGRMLLFSIIRDVDDRARMERKLRETRRKYEAIFQESPLGIMYFDRQGVIRDANGNFRKILGLSEDLTGRPVNSIPYSNLVEGVRVVLAGKRMGFEEEIPGIAGGKTTPVSVKFAPVFRENQEPDGGLAIVEDVSQLKELLDELYEMSYRDHLTGLSNRRHFEGELNRLMESSQCFSLLMGDLNGLKAINDSQGHTRGDQVLQEASRVLRETFPEGALVARVGGDEFAVLLPGADEEEARLRIREVREAMARAALRVPGLSVSFGTATSTCGRVSREELLARAEDQMYQYKTYEETSFRNKGITLVMNALFIKSRREMDHSRRVSAICGAIARELGQGEGDVKELLVAGLVHDIGKIGIPEGILNKPGVLESAEMNMIRSHSEAGARILASVAEFSGLAQYILCHHEHWDGSGYPRGLSGQDIPLPSRIIAVADAFDAMISDRPYRKGMDSARAVRELKDYAGIQFDPQVVDVFVTRVLGPAGEFVPAEGDILKEYGMEGPPA